MRHTEHFQAGQRTLSLASSHFAHLTTSAASSATLGRGSLPPVWLCARGWVRESGEGGEKGVREGER